MVAQRYTIEATPAPCNLLYFTEYDDSVLTVLNYIKNSTATWAVDIETMAKPGFKGNVGNLTDPKTSDIRLIQLYDGGKYTIIFDCKTMPEILADLAIILPHKKLVAHNAKFELKYLTVNGIPIRNIGCTMLMRKILYRSFVSTFDTEAGHAADGGNFGFGAVVHHYLGVDLFKDVDHSGWGNETLNFEQLSYAALDAHYLWHIANLMASELVAYNFVNAYKIQKDAQGAIVAMETEGMVFDKKRHQALIDEWKQIQLDARKEFYELAPDSFTKISSPKAVRELISQVASEEDLAFWPTTASGVISLSAQVLQEYMHVPIVAPYAVFVKYKSLLSKYGQKLKDHISPVSGRVHTQFVLCGAVTGRMSSKTPNLQNIPRDKVVRGIFTAPKGEAIICADYGQIELRVAAILSGDPVMLDAYETGKDIHRLTASGVAGVPYNEVTGEQRTAAKALNFGLIYGMGWKKFIAHSKWNYGITFTEDEAKHAIDAFRNTYQGYYRWQIAQGALCKQLLYADTVIGHRRALDEKFYYTAGLNHPIQGSAGHVLLRALTRLHTFFSDYPEFQGRLCLTVHDEISCYCPMDKAERIKNIVEAEMVQGFLDIFPQGSTHELVEAHIGPDWAKAK